MLQHYLCWKVENHVESQSLTYWRAMNKDEMRWENEGLGKPFHFAASPSALNCHLWLSSQNLSPFPAQFHRTSSKRPYSKNVRDSAYITMKTVKRLFHLQCIYILIQSEIIVSSLKLCCSVWLKANNSHHKQTNK